jgi:hypothetical protein
MRATLQLKILFVKWSEPEAQIGALRGRGDDQSAAVPGGTYPVESVRETV